MVKTGINFHNLALKQETQKKKSTVLEKTYNYISGTPNDKFFWPLSVSFLSTEGLTHSETTFKSRTSKFYKEARKELKLLGFKVKQTKHDNKAGYPGGIFLRWELTKI